MSRHGNISLKSKIFIVVVTQETTPAVSRVRARRWCPPRTNCETPVARSSTRSLPTILKPFWPPSRPIPPPQACPLKSWRNFTPTCNAGAWPTASSALAVTPVPHQMLLAFSGKKRGFCPSCAGRRMAQQAAHLVEQVHSLGADTAVGGLGPDPSALLDGPRQSTHRHRPYHHPPHHRPVLCQASGAKRRNAGRRAARLGHLFATLRRVTPCQSPLPHDLPRRVFVDRTAQGLTPRFVQADPPPMRRSPRYLTRSASASSATCASGAISKRTARTWCAPATIQPVTRTPHWPAPWPLRCSSAWPLASALGSGGDAWARALATQVRSPP